MTEKSEKLLKATTVNLAALLVTIAVIAPWSRGPLEMFVDAVLVWLLPALIVWRLEKPWRYALAAVVLCVMAGALINGFGHMPT